jgi:hypothetical protein
MDAAAWLGGWQNNARHEQRVKPDPEIHPLAQLNYDKEQLIGEQAVGII